jgi:predicted MFS family arabinose efflux permease
VSIDTLGSILLGCAMLTLLFGLIEGSSNDWSLLPITALAIGVLFFVAFCRRQLTSDNPLIQPSLLANRGFTSGLILGIAFFAAVSGLLYVISLFLQDSLHYTPVRTALVGIAPIAAGIVIASIAISRLVTRLGRNLVFIGLLVTLAGSLGLMAAVVITGASLGTLAIVVSAVVIGLGMGTCFGTVYDVTLGDVNPAETGSGSGSLSAVQQLANALGAAAVTTVYFHSDGSVHAMIISLVVVVAVFLASCGLVWLIPRRARPRH